MQISMIAALDKKTKGIGFQGKLPWRIQEDTEYFHAVTQGKIVVMGLTTYLNDCFGQGLPDRYTVVLREDAVPLTFSYTGNKLVSELSGTPDSIVERIIELNQGSYGNEIFICGGASIYKQFLRFTDKLYLTEIDFVNPVATDSFFPDYSHFTETSSSVQHKNDICKFVFKEYQK